jgi:class 3 adenylate cyclase/tetratricopeptide (TPR) repeat protein
MKCPKCQFDNPPAVNFCVECGAGLESICPQCGAANSPSFKFCGKCGYDLRGARAPAPVDYSKPQSYTPKFLADKILKDRSSLEGERKLVTVLFADTVSYTSMSEKLDTEEVRQIMDGCFQILMGETHRYEGTVTQFTGDGAMALFGAPVAHEDHALRACYTALAIRKALEGYGEKVKRDCGVEFKMRIGLNSGPVIVGSVGTDLKMEYTAVGDTVNLASRMQTMAEPGGTLVAPDTYRMAKDFFEFQPVGKLKVKGKEEPIEAYQLLQATEVATRIEAAVIRGLTRFVGRDREIATLREAWEKAKSGSGQVVGIVGEAGVGKSRLLFEVRRMLPEGEYTYLQGSCLHYGGSMPYLPFLDILRSYFGMEEGDREYIIKKKMAEKTKHLDENLKEAMPPIEDILSLKVEDEAYLKLDAPLKRIKIFEAIRDLLIWESQSKPLVVAVEDLHWVDKTSEEFLGYLIGFLANTPVLLLLLYRPEYTHQWGSKSYYRQTGVDQLSLSCSAELVQSILEEGEVAPELRNLILTTAAGNPLFMEEFTHTLLENGSIQRKGHQYVLTRKASEIPVPDTLQAIIAARMDRLEDNLKRTMQVASVIGRDFAYRILQTITGMREDLKAHLLNLQGLEFIYEKSLFPELEYVFKHALTQEVAYNSLLIKRRKEIHQRIGKAIEELYPERLEEFYEMLAHHYSRSENLEKAYQYLLLSTMKVAFNYSLWEAFRLGKEAMNVLSQMPRTEENKRRQIDGRLLLGLVMQALGYPEDSLEILCEGERLSRELGDERSLASCHGSIAMCYSFRGDLIKGREYAEEAFEGARKIGDIQLLVPIGVDLCQIHFWAGGCSRVVEVASEVIASLKKSQRESEFLGRAFNPYSTLLALRGSALGYLGDFEAGEAQCEMGLRFALEINNLASIGLAEAYYSSLFCYKGDGRNAADHGLNAARCGEKAHAVTLLGPAWHTLAWAYYFLGEPERSMEYCQRGIRMERDAGFCLDLPGFYECLGHCHFDSGDWSEAQGCLETALELSQAYHQRHREGKEMFLLGSTLGKVGPSQCGRGEEHILEGIRICCDEVKSRPLCSTGHLFLGELYVDMGQGEKALVTIQKARAMFQEMGMDYWMARTQKAMDNLKA